MRNKICFAVTLSPEFDKQVKIFAASVGMERTEVCRAALLFFMNNFQKNYSKGD